MSSSIAELELPIPNNAPKSSVHCFARVLFLGVRTGCVRVADTVESLRQLEHIDIAFILRSQKSELRSELQH
jgi:hypothetical protein